MSSDPTDRELNTGAAVSGYIELVARHQRFAASDQKRRPNLRFSEFRQTIRRHRPSDLLPALAALAVAGGDPPFTTQMLSNAPPWAVALAARESILWGNEHRQAGV